MVGPISCPHCLCPKAASQGTPVRRSKLWVTGIEVVGGGAFTALCTLLRQPARCPGNLHNAKNLVRLALSLELVLSTLRGARSAKLSNSAADSVPFDFARPLIFQFHETRGHGI